MNTFTTVTQTVLARSHVHPDRRPLSRPGAPDPACHREPLPHRGADLPYPRAGELAVHDGLRVRLDATLAIDGHLPLRVDLT